MSYGTSPALALKVLRRSWERSAWGEGAGEGLGVRSLPAPPEGLISPPQHARTALPSASALGLRPPPTSCEPRRRGAARRVPGCPGATKPGGGSAASSSAGRPGGRAGGASSALLPPEQPRPEAYPPPRAAHHSRPARPGGGGPGAAARLRGRGAASLSGGGVSVRLSAGRGGKGREGVCPGMEEGRVLSVSLSVRAARVFVCVQGGREGACEAVRGVEGVCVAGGREGGRKGGCP